MRVGRSLVPFHRSSDKKSRHRRRRLVWIGATERTERRERVARRRNKKYAKKLRVGERGGSTGNHDNIRLIVSYARKASQNNSGG